MRSTSPLWVCLGLVVGCPAGDAEQDANKGSATAGAAANAAGGAAGQAAVVTECPKSLGGPDRLHRVISRDCGVIEVTEDLTIDGGSLTLEAGASLAFKDGAGLIVGRGEPGKLVVQGTAEAPVVLTSAGDKAAGVWKGVVLHPGAARSSVQGLVIEFAGADEEAALRVDAADVTVTGTAIRSSKTGLVVGPEGGLAAFSDNEFKKIGRAAAIETPPSGVGGLGGGNRFDPEAFVRVTGGAVRRSATWQRIGAPLMIAEDVAIDGDRGERTTLELAPGLELRFAAEGGLTVGYHEAAALVARGSKEAPVTFTASERRERGAWRGVRVHEHGEATFEHAALEFGGGVEGGVIDVRGGTLALTSTTLRSDVAGVSVGSTAKITAFADNTFVATPIAVRIPANLVAALGEGNGFDRDARILVGGETVKGKASWLAQGVALTLEADVAVEGELTLEAGLALLARPDASLQVGNYETAALLAKGTAAAPVTIGPADSAKGTWPGIVLHGNSTGNRLEFLTLTGAANASAIAVKGRANARLNTVTCSKCAGAVVGWECESRVTSSQVLATDGTPRIDAKPEGC
jgi:hypothetical protein